jgi:hypothetical protein
LRPVANINSLGLAENALCNEDINKGCGDRAPRDRNRTSLRHDNSPSNAEVAIECPSGTGPVSAMSIYRLASFENAGTGLGVDRSGN